MRKRVVASGVVVCGLIGCGDDTKAAVDAAPTFDYDLSCLNNSPPTVPATVELTGYLAHYTFETDSGSVGLTPVRIESIDGTSILATATTAENGLFDVDIATGGQLTPARLAYEPTDWGNQRLYSSRAPWRSSVGNMDVFSFFGSKPLRALAIATALGETSDDTKGTVEVWVSDCSWKPMPGATVSLDDHPDAKWVHYNPLGMWIPGPTTIGPGNSHESWSATTNVETGMKHVTVTANGVQIGSVPILVEPRSFNRVLVYPGYGNVDSGFGF